jgi:hypothetical protein
MMVFFLRQLSMPKKSALGEDCDGFHFDTLREGSHFSVRVDGGEAMAAPFIPA